jgi:multicomponent Na+:H+ antiporter subunit B
VTPALRKGLVLFALCGLSAFFLWGLVGVPPFGHYRGPYGDIVNAIAVKATNATGVVSVVNFDFRGFDTVGEEFILFMAAVGVAVVLRQLREEHEQAGRDEAPGLDVPPTSEAVRLVALMMAGPMTVVGWFLVTHAQTNPSGGFQGGVVIASAVVMVYLAGQFVSFKRLSPVDMLDSIEAAGAGGFVAVGLGVLASGAAYLANVLPLGKVAGAVDAGGTIPLISFCVGVEVAGAFMLIVSELLEQTLFLKEGS